jgi:hypothetical protein
LEVRDLQARPRESLDEPIEGRFKRTTVTPTFREIKPFDEHVEGLSHCGDMAYAIEATVQTDDFEDSTLFGVVSVTVTHCSRTVCESSNTLVTSSAVSSCERSSTSSCSVIDARVQLDRRQGAQLDRRQAVAELRLLHGECLLVDLLGVGHLLRPVDVSAEQGRSTIPRRPIRERRPFAGVQLAAKLQLEFLAAVPDARLLESLRHWRGHGRDDYPVSMLWGVLLTILLRHASREACLAEQRLNAGLRKLIRVPSEDQVPRKWNLSRFEQGLGRQPAGRPHPDAGLRQKPPMKNTTSTADNATGSVTRSPWQGSAHDTTAPFG